MSALVHEIGRSIQDYALWAPGDRVAVAASGGADSTALLHLLVETAGWHKGILSVAHFDHGLRPESAADAAFVRDQAGALGLPFTLGEGRLGSASEAEARAARLAFFDAVPADRVALGHHARDQAETVLFRLIRGTGPGGLAGIPRRRDRLVRPLLDVDPEDLRAFLRERGVPWREDPTNADPRYTRNRIRAEVLPLLEDVRPGATRAIARTAAAIAEPAPFDPAVPAPASTWRLPPRRLLAALRTRVSGVTLGDAERVRGILDSGGSIRLGAAEVRVTDGNAVLLSRDDADDPDV